MPVPATRPHVVETMTSLLIVILLGIVEGITEFLPVSSTGHLIITGHLVGFTGPKADAFEVIIQLGAILAVVVLYRSRFTGLATLHESSGFTGRRGLFLLFLTTLPAAIAGLLLHGFIKSQLFHPRPVALALGVGALAILLVESLPRTRRCSSLDQLTPLAALGVGCFQCLALWPGFSRAAATIMGGMVLGLPRRLAAEYSFIAAVPLMFAATGYDLLKTWSLFRVEDFTLLFVGFMISFVMAGLAVKTFIAVLGRVTLRPFAYYRLLLAPLVLWIWT